MVRHARGGGVGVGAEGTFDVLAEVGAGVEVLVGYVSCISRVKGVSVSMDDGLVGLVIKYTLTYLLQIVVALKGAITSFAKEVCLMFVLDTCLLGPGPVVTNTALEAKVTFIPHMIKATLLVSPPEVAEVATERWPVRLMVRAVVVILFVAMVEESLLVVIAGVAVIARVNRADHVDSC